MVVSPKYHVINSQIIASINPAKITGIVENSGCIMPLPTVAAIAVPNTKGPTKFPIGSNTYGLKRL